VEIFCGCPVEVYEAHDSKGLYKNPKAGIIKDDTGNSSPHETHRAPDKRLEAGENSLPDGAEGIVCF
jgi:adenylylsulfate kinase